MINVSINDLKIMLKFNWKIVQKYEGENYTMDWTSGTGKERCPYWSKILRAAHNLEAWSSTTTGTYKIIKWTRNMESNQNKPRFTIVIFCKRYEFKIICQNYLLFCSQRKILRRTDESVMVKDFPISSDTNRNLWLSVWTYQQTPSPWYFVSSNGLIWRKIHPRFNTECLSVNSCNTHKSVYNN